MLIDWFTVAAQAINFLILMWLLKHFLYQPVLDAIDTREQRIARELQEARTTQAAAEQQRAEFESKNAAFEEQHAGLMEQASAEAQKVRGKLLEEARNEAAVLRSQWQEALHKEQQNLRQSIATRTRQQLFGISRKVLKDLAGVGLETRIVAVFIRRLQSLDDAGKASFSAQPGQVGRQFVVRSAFPLPPAEQATLTDAVQQTLSTQSPICFEIEPELISGIELVSGGHKLAWNIADYLNALEESIADLLDLKMTDEGVSGEQADVG